MRYKTFRYNYTDDLATIADGWYVSMVVFECALKNVGWEILNTYYQDNTIYVTAKIDNRAPETILLMQEIETADIYKNLSIEEKIAHNQRLIDDR